jgi:hypothetical protein
MFNKQELDDIWRTKPYGWFTKEIKNRKGAKKYTVTCTVYKEVEVGNTSATVYAKTSRSALESISTQLRSKLNLDLGLSQWSNNHIYRYSVDNG